MQLERRLHIADLSAVDRKRITQAIEGAGSTTAHGTALGRFWNRTSTSAVRAIGVALAAGLLLAYVVQVGFGQLGAQGVVAGTAMVPVYGLLIGLMVGAALWALPRRWLERSAGEPGVYLFAGHIVDTYRPEWVIRSLEGLRDFRATAAGQLRGVDRVRFAVTAADGRKWIYLMHGREPAERTLARMREANTTLRAAATQGSLPAQQRIDPFVGLEGLRSPAVVTAWRHLPRSALAGLVIGAALAWPVQTMRDRYSDERQWAQARAENSELAYLRYLQHPLGHRAEAEAALPMAALADAQRKGTVTALRAALAKYPNGGIADGVAAAVRVIYDKALDQFKANLRRSDPVLENVVAAALRQAEASGDPRVDVRFVRPSPSEIAKLDARISLLTQGVAGTAAAASHFQGDTVAQREGRMARELQTAFSRVFPADVLTANPAPAAVGSSRPRLSITYTIRQSGKVYKSEQTGRQFIGVTIGFAAEMMAAQNTSPWRFKLEVGPPDRFQVSQRSPADASVYAVMADRAFDELSTKLVDSFFGLK